MLSERFRADGKALLSLSSLQQEIKSQIEDKVLRGVYFFESVPCILCSGSDFELLSEKDRYGLFMPVKICKKCGLIQTNPRMTEESYTSFYKLEQKKLYVGKEEPDSKYFEKQYKRGKEIFTYIEQNTKLEIKNLKILEVGCSSGGILLYFKEKCNEILGCDLNQQYVEYGKKKHKLNVEICELKALNLPWNPDIIIYSHTLEHILDPVKELAYLKEKIGKFAYLYIELPGIKNLNKSYNKDFLEYLQNAHIYHFSLCTLVNILKKAGWSLVIGDEYIHSLFISSMKPYSNDYVHALSFLKGIEDENLSF